MGIVLDAGGLIFAFAGNNYIELCKDSEGQYLRQIWRGNSNDNCAPLMAELFKLSFNQGCLPALHQVSHSSSMSEIIMASSPFSLWNAALH